MNCYKHVVSYYETDMMGFTHHSNYIRWMEEARVEFMKELGLPYEKLEALGVVSPVKSVSCDYKMTTTFPDEVSIVINIEEYTGVKLSLNYEMKNEKGDVVCLCKSSHCFIDKNKKIVSLKKAYPEMHEMFMNYYNSNKSL